MEIRNDSFEKDRSKLKRARKKVEALKGFYIHLMVFGAINIMLIIIKVVGTQYYGETFMGPLWHFSTFATPIFWGIGLAFHAMKVFSTNTVFGDEWEQRQIQKFMEKEKKEANKFR